jgi:hypothetical protein
MVSARRVSRPCRLATSVPTAPADPHHCVAPNFNQRVAPCAAAAGRTGAANTLPAVRAIPRAAHDFRGGAPRRHHRNAAGKGRVTVRARKVRDIFCCKKFPTPIAAKKVPHYITHYRALINQLTDPHLNECGD